MALGEPNVFCLGKCIPVKVGSEAVAYYYAQVRVFIRFKSAIWFLINEDKKKCRKISLNTYKFRGLSILSQNVLL